MRLYTLSIIAFFLITSVSFAERTWSRKDNSQWEITEDTDGIKRDGINIQWFIDEIKGLKDQAVYHQRRINKINNKISIFQAQRTRFIDEGLITYEAYIKWLTEGDNSL
jgi:hypothetical protein